jgi:hypothetical protein
MQIGLKSQCDGLWPRFGIESNLINSHKNRTLIIFKRLILNIFLMKRKRIDSNSPNCNTKRRKTQIHAQQLTKDDLIMVYYLIPGNIDLISLHYNVIGVRDITCNIASFLIDERALEWCFVKLNNPIEYIPRLLYYGVPWLAPRNTSYESNSTLLSAAKYGLFNIIHWYLGLGYEFETYVWCIAAKMKNWKLLRWLHEHKYPTNDELDFYAVCSNDISIVKWLHDTGRMNALKDIRCTTKAVINNNLEMYKYLKKQGYISDHHEFWCAISNGNTVIIEWLYLRGYQNIHHACNSAAIHNQLDSLKTLHRLGFPWDQSTFANASRYGSLEMVQWLHKNECPQTEAMCCYALMDEKYANFMYFIDNKMSDWEKYESHSKTHELRKSREAYVNTF